MFSSLTNSTLLGTIICLILAYALLSLLVSAVAEIINGYFNERGRQLYIVISRLFNDGINPNFGQLLYNNPMVANLRKDLNSLPQYISNPMFSQALIDTIGNYARTYTFQPEERAIRMVESKTDPFNRFRAGVEKMAHTDMKLLLLNMVEKSDALGGDAIGRKLEFLDKQIQQWYKDQMDRATGWYKDLIRARLRWIALGVALALNVNSIYLFQMLYTSPQLRNKLLPIAERVADNYARLLTDTTLSSQQKALRAEAMSQLQRGKADSVYGPRLIGLLADIRKTDSLAFSEDTQRLAAYRKVTDLLDETAGLGLPLGWHKGIPPYSWEVTAADKTGNGGPPPARSNKTLWQRLWEGAGHWGLYILGILITAFSISIGAPFWFEMLLKLVNIRRAGKRPDDKN